MKLLYLWVENYKDTIINQSFNISNAYHISFDVKRNELHISKNKDYIDKFYGDNLLDVTAIIGNNGAGKTTITRFLYDYCESVHPYDGDTGETKRIVVYEKKGQLEDEPPKIIIQYCSEDLIIDNSDDIFIERMNLKNIKEEKFLQAEKEHDITAVYFTNAFEISNVMNNQGFSEFSSWGVHKSLCYTPMLSLQRASTELRSHYGADMIDSVMILGIINRYAQNMTADFKASYATSTGYNFLIATSIDDFN